MNCMHLCNEIRPLMQKRIIYCQLENPKTKDKNVTYPLPPPRHHHHHRCQHYRQDLHELALHPHPRARDRLKKKKNKSLESAEEETLPKLGRTEDEIRV